MTMHRVSGLDTLAAAQRGEQRHPVGHGLYRLDVDASTHGDRRNNEIHFAVKFSDIRYEAMQAHPRLTEYRRLRSRQIQHHILKLAGDMHYEWAGRASEAKPNCL